MPLRRRDDAQSAFTIWTPVLPDHNDQLTRLLDELGDHIGTSARLPFVQMDTVHYASFAIMADGAGTPHLLFEGNVDGPARAFLERLVDVAGPTIDEIYEHCRGYPRTSGRTPADVVAHLCAHDIGADVFYVAWSGRTVAEMRREQDLRLHLQALLDAPGNQHLRRRSPQAIHRWLVRQVEQDPELTWAFVPSPRPFRVRHGRKLVLAGAAVPGLGVLGLVAAAVLPGHRCRTWTARAALVALGGTLGALVWRLRSHERADDRRDTARAVDWRESYAAWSANLGDVRSREDVKGQNHIASVQAIKAGTFRSGLLRLVLGAVHIVAGFIFNRGDLGGIASIHFARWVITPDGRGLVFLSNFDGSWESYLGDFIDLSAIGLTGVWSNTDNVVGFPQTRYLLFGGARDEARFKAFGRAGMVATNVWYSAYPDLSVANIANNMAVRVGLGADLDPAAAQAWLRRL